MPNLFDVSIRDFWKRWLQIGKAGNNGLDTTPTAVEDGSGTASPLFLSTNKVQVTATPSEPNDVANKGYVDSVTGSGGASTLDDLTDVTITTATTGQVLTRGAAAWQNSALPSASTAAAGMVTLAHDGEAAATKAVTGTDARLANARPPTSHATSHQHGGADALNVAGLSGALADAQKVAVRKGGTSVASRPALNFIEGANVTLTVTDDAVNNEVDITIAASGDGGGGASTLTDLTDVTITTPTTGQVLVKSEGDWVNAALPSHAHGAGDITSGTLDAALLPDLSSTYAPASHNHDLLYAALAHDHSGVYAPVSHTHNASDITAGTIDAARLPDLSSTYAVTSHSHDAGDVTSGTFDAARLPDLSSTYAVTSHTHDLLYAALDHDHSGVYAPVSHTHDAGDVTTGTFDAARLPDLSSTYAPASHNHDLLYAALDHNHTGVYAAASHTHPHTELTYDGLTAGHVLRASGDTTAAFASLQAPDLPTGTLSTTAALDGTVRAIQDTATTASSLRISTKAAHIIGTDVAVIPLIIDTPESHTAHLVEWRVNGTAIAWIDANGVLHAKAFQVE